MAKNRIRNKSLFKIIESGATNVVEEKRDVLPCKTIKWKDDLGIMINETAVEVSEAEKGLNILNG